MAVQGHAWLAQTFGAPSQHLQWVPRSWDDPPRGAVLIAVAAVGVGLPDLFMLQGLYPLVRKPPVSPGQEACGTVVAVGEGSRFSVGDRIFGPTHFYAGSGGFATHTYLSEAHASSVPDDMTDEQAAGFFIGFRTAHAALVVRAQLTDTESVLVLGGSGGSGAAAITLAKAMGARVVAVASTEAKQRFCRDLGADAVVARLADAIAAAVDQHTDGRGFDVVFDPVGGDIGAAALAAVGRYGRFAAVGFASGTWTTIRAADLAMRNISAVGVLVAGFTPEEEHAHMAELLSLAADGRIRTPIGRVASMNDVPEVLETLGSSNPPGKIVVLAAEAP